MQIKLFLKHSFFNCGGGGFWWVFYVHNKYLISPSLLFSCVLPSILPGPPEESNAVIFRLSPGTDLGGGQDGQGRYSS